MSEEADYLYALEMQKRLNENNSDGDIEEIVDFKPPPPSKKPLQLIKRSNPRSNLDEDYLNRTQNLVHPQWETLDPTPDIFSLFGAFDSKFFQERLKCVTLEWSKRMYSCAGICYSRSNRFGMDVTIRLSEPLLKLRPRKDLVETMLHEMIHAYCFVLNIREGNGGHGPNFKKIMASINKVAGTNITVYHTFHDEVDLYKQHWWRCNGSCQNRSPFFGYVKRTSNRAPSPNDQWWAVHLQSCGGTFMKIKEPEKLKKEKSEKAIQREKKKAAAVVGSSDLRNFFPPKAASKAPATTNESMGKGPIKINGGGTMLLNPKPKHSPLTFTATNATPAAGLSSIASAFPPTSYPGLSTDPFKQLKTIGDNSNQTLRSGTYSNSAPPVGNLLNVRSLRDINSSGTVGEGCGNPGRAVAGFKSTVQHDMSGRGYSLSSKGACNSASNGDGEVDRNHLRNHWLKRFGGSEPKKGRPTDDEPAVGDSKRRRLSHDAVFVVDEVEPPASRNTWVVLDDDIMLQEKTEEVVALSSDSDDDFSPPPRKPIKLTGDARQNAIKREIMDESTNMMMTDDEIQLIDDDYNDDEDLLNTSAAIELADTSLIDDFFGEDTLLKDFKRENDVFPSGSRYLPNPDDDIITCPICQEKMKRCVLAEHLDGCTGIAVKIIPPKHALKKLSSSSRVLKPTRRSGISRQSATQILRNAGYSEQVLENITSASSADDEDDFLSSSALNSTSPPRSSAIVNLNSSSESEELDESSRRYRQRNLFKTTRQCPVCSLEIEEAEMNEHLDDCLSK